MKAVFKPMLSTRLIHSFEEYIHLTEYLTCFISVNDRLIEEVSCSDF